MLKRFIPIATLVLALGGGTAVSAHVEQGKGKSKQAVYHAQKNKQKNKTKDKSVNRGQGNVDDRWTDAQRARFAPVLPAGMTLEQAAAGFPNHGQAVAALNAAREHNVSFVRLKHLMLNERLSLGEALRRLGR
jgi:hypothetical protein